MAVVIIGWLTLQLGRRSTDASERSATAAIQAAEATERSVEASERSAEASLQAAQATERSVAASEAAARLAAQDARMRRVEAVLDVVLQRGPSSSLPAAALHPGRSLRRAREGRADRRQDRLQRLQGPSRQSGQEGSGDLAYRSRRHHIGITAAYKDWRVVMLVAGLDIRIVGLAGSPLRHLTLDPTKDYQPIGG
jgi:hypothetical protein